MRIFEPAPAVIGHRGAGEVVVSGLAENTLASCLAAHEQGAGWVELDARLTVDDALVLHHDDHLPDGRPVDEATLDQCRAQGLESFDEVLEELPDGLGVDLEVKPRLADARADAHSSTAGRVAARATELRRRRGVVLTSFDPASLGLAGEVAPDVPRGPLAMPITPLRELVAAGAQLGCRLVAPHAVSLGVTAARGLPTDAPARIAEAVEVAHGIGIEVLTWGVQPEHLEPLADLGVDAVCVDLVGGVAEALATART